MKSSLLPDTYLYETKPWQDNEGMFICITESGRELLKELKRNKKENINEKKEIIEEKQKREWFDESKNTWLVIENWYIITIKWKKYFLKEVHYKWVNCYEESLWLIYTKNKIKNKYSNKKMEINILEPLIAIYNKKNWKSFILLPMIEDYKSVKKFLYDDIYDEIEDTLNEIKNNLKITDKIKITDISTVNTAIRRDNWLSKLTIHDTAIEHEDYTSREERDNIQKTQTIHKLFTQNS